MKKHQNLAMEPIQQPIKLLYKYMGDKNSPAQITDILFTERYKHMLHYHDFFELFFVMKGTLMHNVNNNVYILKKNSLSFLYPEDIHFLKPSSAKVLRGNTVFRMSATRMCALTCITM